MRLTRSDRSLLSEWWFTVDRLLLSAVLLLMAAGLVLSLAASPPTAVRLGLEPFHFVKRHALLLLPAVLLLVAVSLFGPRHMRRLGLVLYGGGMLLTVVALLLGEPIKGAARWLQWGGFSIQPSELVKPGFVVLSAWLFSEWQRRSDVPSLQLSVVLYLAFAAVLALQPDFGQALLITLVWGGLLYMTGVSMIWVVAFSALGALALLAAYFSMPHVANRIDRFIDPSAGDTYQMDRALESFTRGGWFGRGPGEGTVKHQLPDSHTDFIFAVAAEEYGLLACLLLVALLAFVVLRGFAHALKEQDAFVRHAVAGLMLLFGVQALINLAVNVALLPAKGMTLPLISYGGSSLLSVSIVLGLALGLTRRRPRTVRRQAEEPARADLRDMREAEA